MTFKKRGYLVTRIAPNWQLLILDLLNKYGTAPIFREEEQEQTKHSEQKHKQAMVIATTHLRVSE